MKEGALGKLAISYSHQCVPDDYNTGNQRKLKWCAMVKVESMLQTYDL